MTTIAQPVLVSESRAHPRETGALEFLLVGGATPLLFLSSWLLRRTVGLDSADLAVGFLFFYGAHFINDPHFSVTYLLFYEDARARAFGREFAPWQRARYLVAGIVVPVGLVAWAATALAARSPYSLGLLIQLMFFLVGWHYVKQGFGVMTVLAARRGVRLLPASASLSSRIVTRDGPTRGRAPTTPARKSRRRASSTRRSRTRTGSSSSHGPFFLRPRSCSSAFWPPSGDERGACRS